MSKVARSCSVQTSDDPAIVQGVTGLDAVTVTKAVIVMKLVGGLAPDDKGQLYWGGAGQAVMESTSVMSSLERDGAMHTYTLDLSKNTRWRGTISSLRFDPCASKDVTVTIDEIRLEK